MRTGAAALLVWAVLLGVFAALLAAFGDRPLAWGLLAWAAGGAAALAVWRLLRARGDADPVRVSEFSPSTAGVVGGVAVMAMGAEFGMWVVGIGAFLFVVGAAGLLRERAQEARR